MQADHSRPPLDDAAQRSLRALAGELGPRTRVGVLTGAGLSAASGVPTFRGDEGLWRHRRAEELATPEAFAADPALVWEWYGGRRDHLRRCGPNPAHRALLDLSERVGELRIITQNVDDLHRQAQLERAGTPVVPLVELHGNLWRMRCESCDREREDRRPGPAPGELPRCECGGLLRPAVVWFGEPLHPTSLRVAHAVATTSEVFLVVGTSAVVHPAAAFASVAAHHGAVLAEFNPDATELSDRAAHGVRAGCEVALPELVRLVDRERGR